MNCRNNKIVFVGLVMLLLSFLMIIGCYENKIETVSINNLTMSTIVFADLNSIEDVEAEVVFDKNVVEGIEKTMGSIISTTTNEYIIEKEKELQKKNITVNNLIFVYDPNLSNIDKENLEERFQMFAPNDDYYKVVKALGQMAQGEAGGCSHTEIAATMWSVLNRYDLNYSNSIFTIISSGAYHGYHSWINVREDINEIAEDVIARWVLEQEGVENSGRVLPQGYCWFFGDGVHNHFRNKYRTNERWDWSLPTPYEN